MASVQQARALEKVSDKDGAKVDELVKQAKNEISKNNIKVLDQQGTTAGCIFNGDKCLIKLYKTHDFSGNFVVKPPEDIAPVCPPGVFVHQGIPPNGQLPSCSKGAVYYGNVKPLEAGGVKNVGPVCGWLLAWSVPGQHVVSGNCPKVRNRVYVKAGILNEDIDWTEVEKKLDESGSESHSFDPSTGAKASAAITNDSNMAALGSVFTKVDPVPRN